MDDHELSEAESRLMQLTYEILSPEWSLHPFWSVDSSRQLYTLLAAFDSFAVVHLHHAEATQGLSPMHMDRFVTWQTRKAQEEGLVFATRALLQRHVVDSHSSDSWEDINTAGQFLMRSIEMSTFELWRQNVKARAIGVHYRHADRTFRFTYEMEDGRLCLPTAFHEFPFGSQAAKPIAAAESPIVHDVAGFIPEVCYHSGHLDMLNELRMANALRRSVWTPGQDTDARMVDLDDTIGGIALRSFLLVHHSIAYWSRTCLHSYFQMIKDGFPQNVCMPTQVVGLNRLVRYLRRCTDLSESVITMCLEWMRYDSGDNRSDPFIQPLFYAGDKVMWSVCTVLYSHPLRNVLKRLARHKLYQNEVATIIGNRSTLLAEALAGVFRALGYVCHVDTKLKVGTLHGDIDVLCWTPDEPDTVMLIECKAMLTPDGVLELEAAAAERKRAEGQIAKMQSALRLATQSLLRQKFSGIPWEQVSKMCGITCFLQGLPWRYDRSTQFPCCSLTLIENRLTNSDLKTPSALCRVLATFPWVTESKFDTRWESMRLGEYVFEQPKWRVSDDLIFDAGA